MPIEFEFLKRTPYFASLTTAELGSITHLFREKVVGKGEIVFLEGEAAEELYLVASGIVKVFKTSVDGKEQILSIVYPGEPLNDVAIFDGGPNPASAQAVVPVVLYSMKKSDLAIVLRSHPSVPLNVIKVMANRVRRLTSLVEDLSFRHVINRIAKILLQYVGDGTGTGRRLTQQEMAAMAGTVREVVGRSLKVLEEGGAIRLDRHRIVIIDKEALKNMAAMST